MQIDLINLYIVVDRKLPTLVKLSSWDNELEDVFCELSIESAYRASSILVLLLPIKDVSHL